MYTQHNYCRACGFAKPKALDYIKSNPNPDKLIEVFDLGLQPLANDFCRPGQEQAGYAPLKVLFCPRCTLAQLSVTVRPDILYSQYSYVTSTSDTMRSHFDSLLRDIARVCTGRKLLEIGSNDGALLHYFQERNYDVVGVDPAENLTQAARTKGVRTITSLWNEEAAGRVREIFEPDVILARHVFCHCADWRGFIETADAVSGKKTIVCIEAPHAQSLLDNCEFDTIYHEHLSYLTLRAVDALLKDSPFALCGIQKYPIHGGALMLILCRRECLHGVPEEIQIALEEERCGLERWQEFSIKAHELSMDLAQTVYRLKSENRTIAALGASAKSTVWLNACKLRRQHIAFVADSTPQKWYTTSPGTDIPVVDEGAILRELPDYTIMFCWNFKDEVLVKNVLYHEKGGKFIVPVPTVTVV